MKSILILFVLLSCKTGTIIKPVPAPSIDNEKHGINFSEITNASVAQRDKILKAQKKIDEVVSSSCFEKFILDTDRKIIKTNGKSRAELLLDLKTNSHKVEIIFYNAPWYKRIRNNVHGYTYPNVDKIWLNNKFHTGTTVCSEASNLHHEASHKYGYGHSFKSSFNRQFSVPYTINAAYSKCCK